MKLLFTPAVAADFEALLQLRIEAMRESLERVGRFDPDRARARFLSGFSPGDTWHIDTDEGRAGFFTLKRLDDADWLLDHLYIHPSFQRSGIGSAVLHHVFSEADRARKNIRVGALRGSDSNRFYHCHGFVLIEEAEWDLYYVRTASMS